MKVQDLITNIQSELDKREAELSAKAVELDSLKQELYEREKAVFDREVELKQKEKELDKKEYVTTSVEKLSSEEKDIEAKWIEVKTEATRLRKLENSLAEIQQAQDLKEKELSELSAKLSADKESYKVTLKQQFLEEVAKKLK